LLLGDVDLFQRLTNPLYSCCIGDYGIAYAWKADEDAYGQGIAVEVMANLTWGI